MVADNHQNEIWELKLLYISGKECDPYDLGEQRLMIAKHRIPTEDVVSPTCFPDRGRALTWPSKCRFEHTRGQGMKMPPATA